MYKTGKVEKSYNFICGCNFQPNQFQNIMDLFAFYEHVGPYSALIRPFLSIFFFVSSIESTRTTCFWHYTEEKTCWKICCKTSAFFCFPYTIKVIKNWPLRWKSDTSYWKATKINKWKKWCQISNNLNDT